jgi:hypothetical protein
MAVETKKGSTFIKHYYSETFEDEPHYTAEITVDEDATISEMCRAFELFLKVSGYHFDGVVDIVEDNVPVYPPRWAATSDRNSVFDEKM